MTINRLHDEIERGIEALWARQQDAQCIEKLRARLEAENEMAANVAQLQGRPSA